MKKDLKEKLINRKIKKPNPILMFLGMRVLGILNKKYKVRFSYDYDKKTLKGTPTVLLSAHSSRLEFVYTVYGFKKNDINMVCGYQNILQRGLYKLFISLGVISKYLYQPDLVCVKNMYKILKRGGTLGLFPEGIQSTSGSTHPINPATAQFIKRSKANVVVATSKGAYLATNRYSSDRKKGYIGIEYSLLFTPEMLSRLTEDEIYKMLLEKIKYNDFEFNKTARNKYVGKKPNAFGLTKILYICPNCKKEHTLIVDNDTVICSNCDFKARVNEYYDLVDQNGQTLPYDIDKWYKWQRRIVSNQIKDNEFELTMKATLCELKLDKLRSTPNDRRTLSIGETRLTNHSFTIKGSHDDAPADFEFDVRSIYSLTASTKGYLEFYHKNDYYMLIPENDYQCLIKWTLASEEIHNLYDEKWRDACADVYEYDKGEMI